MNSNAKYKILVVDDVRENLLLVDKVLTNFGYTTITVSDGLSALRISREKDIDLILLDIMMPIMSGLETCRYLKADERTSFIPVIFLTADTDRDTLTKAYRVGGSDYIRKPFFKEELLARVESRLKLRDYEKNLEEKVEQRTKDISDTQIQLMLILGGIAEGHSTETHMHVKRVTEFTYKLARLYGMEEKEAKELKDASSLHDIGKLAIKDHILHKEDTLSKDEYKEMRKHAEYGVSMLEGSKLPLFETAKIVAAQHHEQYDGSGYPNRLKGEEIHIYGRIVALADVFDALSFRRSYKEGWSKEEVLVYIRDMRGKHFDPVLVDLFFDNLDDFLDIYDMHVEKNKLVSMLSVKKRNKFIEWLLRRR